MNLLYSLLAVDTSKPLSSLSEKFLYGGEMLLIGVATVFSSLILILLILLLFKNVFGAFGKKESTKNPLTQEPAPAVIQESGSNEEIVAVIAAAIAMAESESNGLKFRVVSFRRK